MPLKVLCPVCKMSAPASSRRDGYEIEDHNPDDPGDDMEVCAGTGRIVSEDAVIENE